MYGVFNGELQPVDEIRISPTDLGLSRGYAVFDFFRVNQNKPVFIEDHLSRLQKSVDEMKLPFNWSAADLKQMVIDVIAKNNMPVSGIKILVTGGDSPDGFTCSTPNLIITQQEISQLPQSSYLEGEKLITIEYQRDSPEAKTTNYGQAQIIRDKISEEGAMDALYHYNGFALETSRTNVFIVKNGQLATAEAEVLGGITRSKVIALAREYYQVETRKVRLEEVFQADEVFVTSTLKRVLPITKLDNEVIGSGHPGPVTKKVMNLFADYENKYLEAN